MSQFPVSLPGVSPVTLTLTPRMLFIMDTNVGDFLPGGKIIDGIGSRDPGNTPVTELRNGMVLGKIANTGTASGNATAVNIGMYAPAIIGTLTAAITNATTVTAITLTVAAATELVRRVGTAGTLVLTGAPTATGTVASNTVAYSSVATATGVVTVTTPATAYTQGTWVGANDGSAVPVTLLAGASLGPVKVTDINGNNLQVPDVLVPITVKPVYTTNVVDYPAAANTTLIAYLKTKLRVAVPGMAFDDDF